MVTAATLGRPQASSLRNHDSSSIHRSRCSTASAHSGRLWGADVERRVSADGVAITRVTRDGNAVCHMSGATNFVPGILHDATRPQAVKCPPDDDGWSRE